MLCDIPVLPFKIYGKYDGCICDEGCIWQSAKGSYWLQCVGLGVTRRISKRKVYELYNSDIRIDEELTHLEVHSDADSD